jgi:hypothetical protein
MEAILSSHSQEFGWSTTNVEWGMGNGGGGNLLHYIQDLPFAFVWWFQLDCKMIYQIPRFP